MDGKRRAGGATISAAWVFGFGRELFTGKPPGEKLEMLWEDYQPAVVLSFHVCAWLREASRTLAGRSHSGCGKYQSDRGIGSVASENKKKRKNWMHRQMQ